MSEETAAGRDGGPGSDGGIGEGDAGEPVANVGGKDGAETGADGAETGADDSPSLDPLSLDEALSIVGEETRARIVVALGEAWDEAAARPVALSFSELMERVDATDSGRFNYHLDKLVGTFVAKSDEGYMLKQPGHLLHQTIVAGTLTDRDAIERFPVGDCPDCDGAVTARYKSDHLLAISCPECGEDADCMYFPPRGAEDRSPGELVDAAYQLTHHYIGLLRRGICHGCGSRVERDLAADVADVWTERFGFDAFATLVCPACHESIIGHPVNVALTTPAVVSFYHDHGRDVARVRSWDDSVERAARATTAHTDHPPTVTVPFELADERLELTLDDDLQVVREERTSR